MAVVVGEQGVVRLIAAHQEVQKLAPDVHVAIGVDLRKEQDGERVDVHDRMRRHAGDAGAHGEDRVRDELSPGGVGERALQRGAGVERGEVHHQELNWRPDPLTISRASAMLATMLSIFAVNAAPLTAPE
jgi:hypothetical protein